jgi:hypothetical protein
MDWTNERYVRAYVRDTADYLVLSWQARGLWWEIIRKADRSGVVATNHGARGVAALVRWPIEVVQDALAELVEDGCIQECPGGFVLPNYMPAQESAKSTSERKRESRESRRLQMVTNRDPSGTNRDQESQSVTPSHTESRNVTPNQTKPNQEREGDAAAPLADSSPPKPDKAAILSGAAVDEINRLRGTRYQADSEDTVKACGVLAKRGVTPEQLVAVIRYIACPRPGSEGWLAVEHLRERVCPGTLLQAKRVRETLATIEATKTGPQALRFETRSDNDFSRIPDMGIPS